jgi:hypothetical protein
MCADNGHKMVYKPISCSSSECNSEKECKFRYKVIQCCRTNKIELYSLNSHSIHQRFTCVYFLDQAICKHLLHPCKHLLHPYNLNHMNPPGVVTKKTFSIKTLRERAKQASRAL